MNKMLTNKERIEKLFHFSFIAVMLSSLLLTLTIFLPFGSAKKDLRERLQKHPDTIILESPKMTNRDAVHMSLLEYGKIYHEIGDKQIRTGAGIFYTIFIASFAGCTILTLLFSLLKKPVIIMIFDILSLCIFSLLRWDFKDRGVIPSSKYDWGLAQYICYTSILLILISAIILLISKIKMKRLKQMKIALNEEN